MVLVVVFHAAFGNSFPMNFRKEIQNFVASGGCFPCNVCGVFEMIFEIIFENGFQRNMEKEMHGLQRF